MKPFSAKNMHLPLVLVVLFPLYADVFGCSSISSINAFILPLGKRPCVNTCTRSITNSHFSKTATTTDQDIDTNDLMCKYDYEECVNIFTKDTPLLDVRAEVEFAKGAFPNSVNIPILDDEQRHLVGICRKEKGAEAAFDLGEGLVTPLKQQRITAWKKHADANPAGYMYCFRGGSRSQISHLLLKEEAGVDYPLVTGGYKAMRTFLMDELERVQDLPIVMIGGRTASGKTHLLKHFTRHVDLEGIANHRGSAFGGLVAPQPTQINFENGVAIEFLKLRTSGSGQPGGHEPMQPILIEEEGRRIGQLTLPLSMNRAMVDRYPVLELETPMEDRVRICIQDYVTDMFPLFQSKSTNQDLAHENFREAHLNSLGCIKNRLPGYNEISAQLMEGLDLFQHNGDDSGFYDFTERMLLYYDKFYDYQMDQRRGEVLFRGDSKSIIEWTESEEGRRKFAML